MDIKVERRATEEELGHVKRKRNHAYSNRDIKDIEGWVVDTFGLNKKLVIIGNNDENGRMYNYINPDDLLYIGFWSWDDKLGQAIKNWEIKHQLSSNTLKTFNELIDEL